MNLTSPATDRVGILIHDTARPTVRVVRALAATREQAHDYLDVLADRQDAGVDTTLRAAIIEFDPFVPARGL